MCPRTHLLRTEIGACSDHIKKKLKGEKGWDGLPLIDNTMLWKAISQYC